MKFYEFQHILSEERLQRYLLACDNDSDGINILRNRIAHHEPICFARHQPEIGTSYILNAYQTLHKLFLWMGIDSHSLLYDLDHVQQVCSKINNIKS